MKTVIYFLRNDASLYMDTHLPEQAVKAFEACEIKSYIFPEFLKEQAI